MQNGDLVLSVNEHSGLISDLQMSKDHTMAITASKDTSAKVYISVLRTISTGMI